MRKRIFREWARRCVVNEQNSYSRGFYVHCPTTAVDGPEYKRVMDFWLANNTEPLVICTGHEKAIFLLLVAEAELAV